MEKMLVFSMFLKKNYCVEKNCLGARVQPFGPQLYQGCRQYAAGGKQ
jgi:hypothetical protein